MLDTQSQASNTNSSKQIKLGAAMSYTAIAFNIIAGLIYTPWMIRTLGRADYGLFALVGSFLTYFVMDFGLGNAIARFMSKYKAENREEAIGELLGLTAKLYLLIDFCILVLLVILFFFIENIFLKLSPIEIDKFQVIYCIAGFFSIISFPFIPLNSILIANERFFVLKLCNLLNKVFTIGLMVLALLAGYRLYALVAVNAVVGIAIIIIKILYLSKTCPVNIKLSYFSRDLLKQLFKFSIWVTVIGIGQRMLINVVPALLGILSGSNEIAVFSVGMTIEGYTWMFAIALGGLFLPKVSRLAATANRDEITKLMIKVGRIQLFVVGIIVVGFITLGQQFLSLWVGPGFERSYWVVLFLMIPGLITLTQEIAYTLLYVENKINYWAILLLCASMLTICISLFLSPHYGAIGSAVGIFTAYLFCHIIGMNIVFSRVLKLHILKFFFECHLKLLLPLLLTLGTGFLINIYIPSITLLTFLPKAGLLMSAYLIFIWILALNGEEKMLARSIIPKLLLIRK